MKNHNLNDVDIRVLKGYNQDMDIKLNKAVAEKIKDFSLPRYKDLPVMGLYLEQTAKYINKCVEPLGCSEITGSMIRNYVKMGLVSNPVKKLYYRDQISHLIPITILKNVLPLEYFGRLFLWQEKIYSDETAYNYFCMELENVLFNRFGIKQSIDDIGETSSLEKEILRSAVTAVSHTIFIKFACDNISDNSSLEE